MFRGKRKTRDFESEIEAHLQLEADRLQEQGLLPEDALLAARRGFGNVTHAEERFYETGRSMPWDNFRRDIRFAARVLAKDPRFSILAVLGLALGIGISTAIFTLINLQIRAESAGREGNSYVGLNAIHNGRPRDFSYSEYRYYRDRATSFADVAADSGWQRFILQPLLGGAESSEVQGRFVSANFLTAGGLHPALGRTFTPAEEQSGSPAVAVLDYSWWMRQFAGDPAILGRTVVLNAQHLTIVGVSDPGFALGNTAQLYLPLALQPTLLQQGDWLHDDTQDWLTVEAWLRPGVPVGRAQTEIDVLAKALHPTAPGADRVAVSAGGPNPAKRKEIMAMVVAVTLAVSMILLIACSNLANLLLARAAVRRREIGVRLSLGASRLRLISQLLTESMLLALAGGCLGLVIAYWLAKATVLMAEFPPSMLVHLHKDPRVVLYALALSLATGLSFGLAPALAATRTNLSQALHAETLATADRDRRLWSPRNLLVIVPLAVSLMLLLGAGVAIRRVQHSYRSGPGFDISRLVSLSLRLNMQGYDEARTRQFQDNLLQRAGAIPGVASVAMATSMPLGNSAGWFPFAVEGTESTIDSMPHTDYNIVSPGYFETIGVRMVRGRGFTVSDREGSAPVVLVNEDLARSYWPNQESIGKQIRLVGGTTFFEVVGVAPDMGDANERENAVRPTVYVPFAQGKLFLSGLKTDPPAYQMQFLVRTAGAPAAAMAALHREILSSDAGLRVHIQTIQDALEERIGPVRTISMLLGALGGLALFMASVGVYGILSYAVSQRTREIGIRGALGAQKSQIVFMIMRRTVLRIAAGIGCGLLFAFVLTRIFARNFAKFGELDAVTCATVSLILGGVALLASYLPARKALRVDPVQAVRCE